MQSLSEILSNRNFDEPTEVTALRSYIYTQYDVTPTITVQKDYIVLRVPSAALANNLKMDQLAISRFCKLTKKLVIRAGQ